MIAREIDFERLCASFDLFLSNWFDRSIGRRIKKKYIQVQELNK